MTLCGRSYMVLLMIYINTIVQVGFLFILINLFFGAAGLIIFIFSN